MASRNDGRAVAEAAVVVAVVEQDGFAAVGARRQRRNVRPSRSTSVMMRMPPGPMTMVMLLPSRAALLARVAIKPLEALGLIVADDDAAILADDAPLVGLLDDGALAAVLLHLAALLLQLLEGFAVTLDALGLALVRRRTRRGALARAAVASAGSGRSRRARACSPAARRNHREHLRPGRFVTIAASTSVGVRAFGALRRRLDALPAPLPLSDFGGSSCFFVAGGGSTDFGVSSSLGGAFGVSSFLLRLDGGGASTGSRGVALGGGSSFGFRTAELLLHGRRRFLLLERRRFLALGLALLSRRPSCRPPFWSRSRPRSLRSPFCSGGGPCWPP